MQFTLILSSVVNLLLCLNTVTVDGQVDTQVMIVGGGPAGIHAAGALLKRNITDFIILEAQSQLRGYLKPVDFGGFTFAPGGLWGHSPILDKLNERNIPYHISNYTSLVVRNDAGEDITAPCVSVQAKLNKAHDGIAQVAEDIGKGKRPDISLKATLAREGWIATSGGAKALEWCYYDFFKGISTREYSTGGRYRQKGLYTGDYFILDDVTLSGPLLGDEEKKLQENNVNVRLNQRVVTVDQTAGDSVKTVTEDGTECTGEYVIVTSTVGVLQHGGVTFNPPLPKWKTEEICRFQMGTIDSIFLKFESKFWEDVEWIAHASQRRGYYPMFMNLEAEGLKPVGTNILIGFLTGDEAYRAEQLTDDEVKAEVLKVLRDMYGAENVPDPTEFYMSRFATDPSLYGNLCNFPIGTIPEDAQQRIKGQVGRVFFASEDATDEHISIPFGSVKSGQAAGMKVANCLQGMPCEEYYPMDPEAPPMCRDVKPNNPAKGRKTWAKANEEP